MIDAFIFRSDFTGSICKWKVRVNKPPISFLLKVTHNWKKNVAVDREFSLENFWFYAYGQRWKIGIVEKTRQNAENKQTFESTAKIEIEEKTCQNAENKHTLDLTWKIEIEEKTCQIAENKQTFSTFLDNLFSKSLFIGICISRI